MTPPDKNQIWAQSEDRIRSLRSAHRLRTDEVGMPDPNTPDTGRCRIIDGKSYINFCSNDYLDLAHHPKVKQAAIDAVNTYGAGATASRLVCGNLPIHLELEDAIAKFKGVESALVYSSGYLACLGAIQTLCMRADDSRIPVIFDRLSHASLVDGATQDRRNWRSYPHNDLDGVEKLLSTHGRKDWPSAIVVTEGVFSMDGDVAPLKALAELCKKHQALLVIDDAHGTGIMGEHGKGSASAAGIAQEPYVVQIGTLSKAFGSQGGYVAGPKIFREVMINVARTFIFDTGLNPAAAGAALQSIKVIQDEPDRLERFRNNVKLFRRQLNQSGCDPQNPTPIIPIFLRDEDRALVTANKLREDGFLVAAIRPPTVPHGTSRLRVTITTAHHEDEIRRLAQSISQLDIQ